MMGDLRKRKKKSFIFSLTESPSRPQHFLATSGPETQGATLVLKGIFFIAPVEMHTFHSLISFLILKACEI